MKVTVVTTIRLDRDEEIPYTVGDKTYRISAVASVDGRKPLIYSRRVYADGRASQGTLRYHHDLPADAVEQVAEIVRAHAVGVTS